VTENMSVFKYQNYLDSYENCPPPEYQQVSMSAFRWIFEDINHENNFKPVLLIKPERINDKMFDSQERKCEGYALSLYDSLSNAKKAYERIRKRNKNLPKMVGTHVAKIALAQTDGVAYECSRHKNNKGHFNFHESENTDLSNQIVTVEKL
jgi:hypothetical protein